MGERTKKRDDSGPEAADPHTPIQEHWSDAQIRQRISALPIWRGGVDIEPLIGGLCNRSYLVTDGDRKFVARVGFDILVHGITQTAVQTSMTTASALGIAPRLRYAEPNLTVVDFLDGGCLRPPDINDADGLAKIMERLKRLHAGSTAIRGPLTYFWPFQVVRHYVQVGEEWNSRLKGELPKLAEVASRLERAIRPFTPVFTHNDLAPQNMMFDGRGDVWLIDWDYGGYGHPLFDITAVGANADSTEALDRKAVELYFGGIDDALWREFNAFKLILNLREYMWGMVQEVVSKLDSASVAASMAELYPEQAEGYEGYTDLNRARFERNWEIWRREFA